MATVKQQLFVFGHAANRTPFLNMINVCLGGSIVSVPLWNFARTIFMLWLIGCFVLRNAYLGSLFDVLQNLHSPSFETVDELIDANFTLYMATKYNYFFDYEPRARPL